MSKCVNLTVPVRAPFLARALPGWGARENILMCDTKGVLYKGRKGRRRTGALYAETSARTLANPLQGADIFRRMVVCDTKWCEA
jgi:malic enzyme